MSSYEIAIYGMTDEDMHTIQSALAAHNVTDAGDEEVGMYLQDNKPRSVFVDPSEVQTAVDIINMCGFATDEDYVVDDEPDVYPPA